MNHPFLMKTSHYSFSEYFPQLQLFQDDKTIRNNVKTLSLLGTKAYNICIFLGIFCAYMQSKRWLNRPASKVNYTRA